MDKIASAVKKPPAPRKVKYAWTRTARAGLLWAGVVVPVQCFAWGLLGVGSLDPRSQSTDAVHFAELLLGPPTIPFWPLLGYSMVCLVLLLVDFRRWQPWQIVRWGIYSGVLLAVQYMLIVFMVVVSHKGGIVLAIAWLIVLAYPALDYSPERAKMPVSVQRLGSWAKMFGGLAHQQSARHRGIHWTVFAALVVLVHGSMFAIVLALVAYVAMAWSLWRWPRCRRRQFSLRQLFAVCIWAALYSAAWRASYTWMLADYAVMQYH